MQRVLIVSDTHGFLDPRIARLAAECDAAVHAGDIGAASVLDQLRAAAGVVIAVRGNNDVPSKWAAEEHGVLAGLPHEAHLELPGGRLAVVHGDRFWICAERHGRLRRRFPRARLVVYGHSHRQVCDLRRIPWIVNPGAGGRTHTFGGPSCLILHAAAARWYVEARRFPRLGARAAAEAV